eukprot:3522470-Heterocapsa_arctica.AAC.1
MFQYEDDHNHDTTNDESNYKLIAPITNTTQHNTNTYMKQAITFIAVGGLLGVYKTSVFLRLNIGLSGSELVEHDKRFVRSSMVMTRMPGLENATG